MTLKQKLQNLTNEIAVKNGYTDARALVDKYAYEARLSRYFKQIMKQ